MQSSIKPARERVDDEMDDDFVYLT